MSGLVIISLIIDSSRHHISIINMKRHYISTYGYYKSFLREISNPVKDLKDGEIFNNLGLFYLSVKFQLKDMYTYHFNWRKGNRSNLAIDLRFNWTSEASLFRSTSLNLGGLLPKWRMQILRMYVAG